VKSPSTSAALTLWSATPGDRDREDRADRGPGEGHRGQRGRSRGVRRTQEAPQCWQPRRGLALDHREVGGGYALPCEGASPALGRRAEAFAQVGLLQDLAFLDDPAGRGSQPVAPSREHGSELCLRTERGRVVRLTTAQARYLSRLKVPVELRNDGTGWIPHASPACSHIVSYVMRSTWRRCSRCSASTDGGSASSPSRSKIRS